MPRILIVDDEPLIASLLEEWLSDLDCDTIGPVGSVREALEALQRERPDGAILDVSLGRENAYPVADALMVQGVPFVFATGYSDSHIDERYRAVPKLNKPFDFNNVEARVSAMLDGARRVVTAPQA